MLDSEQLVHGLAHPRGPWRRIDVHEQVDSTNVQAAADPTAWRIVVAAEQTGGLGRLGRAWASPPGTSVAMSMVVPVGERPDDLGWVPLATGLAVVRALVDLTGRPHAYGLKWPNDVLAAPWEPGEEPAEEPAEEPGGGLGAGLRGSGGGRGAGPGRPVPAAKVCGILCQLPRPGLVVVGIGVNVSAPPDSLPVATASAAVSAAGGAGGAADAGGAAAVRRLPPVSLAQCVPGEPPTREDVVLAVAARLAQALADLTAGGGAESLRSAYRRGCLTVGRDVEVHLPGGLTVPGHAESIDAQGRLVVRERSTGALRHFAAGDVFHIRAADRA